MRSLRWNGTVRVWLGYPDTIDAAENYFESLKLGPGAHLIRYGTTSKTPWVYVLMDPQAFRMWIDHEEFHLIC